MLAAGNGATAYAGLSLPDPIVTVDVCWTSLHREFLNTVVDSHFVRLMGTKDQKHFFAEEWRSEIGTLFPHLFEKEDPQAEQAAASDSGSEDDW